MLPDYHPPWFVAPVQIWEKEKGCFISSKSLCLGAVGDFDSTFFIKEKKNEKKKIQQFEKTKRSGHMTSDRLALSQDVLARNNWKVWQLPAILAQLFPAMRPLGPQTC